MEAVFQDEIRTARDAGRTVLLSSHILAEVEALCDRVSIIRDGRNVDSGTLDELRHLTRTSITVETEHEPSGLGDLPGIHGLRIDGGRATFDVDTARIGAVVEQLAPLGVRSLQSHPPTLEELFLRHYGGPTDDDTSRRDDALTADR
jgi:ABC-2 type transport system ATP-binding protein